MEPQHKRYERDIRFAFVAVSCLVSIACLFAWAEVFPAEYVKVALILSGVFAIAGIAILWFLVAPIVRMALAHDRADGSFYAASTRPSGWNEPHPNPAGSNSLSHTDPLTGLGNRARMREKFNRLVKDRDCEETFAIGLMNLDGMKPINDLFGHIGGDDIIKQCAQRLAAAVDSDGLVCRCGGDEFGFIFPKVTSEFDAEEKGRLLQSVLLAPFNLDGRTIRLSGSFGLTIHRPGEEDFPSAMAKVETALYFSKRRGRGGVTIHSDEIEKLVHEDARLEQALREAIAEHGVRPFFQPIVSLQDGRLLGFEALARWIDPQLGAIPPSRFIPLAEERGLIAPLTESLLMQAASAASQWPEELFLSFNLSGLQLVDATTAANVMEIIGRAGLPASRLEIEVTETAVMSDPETAARIIDDLHREGIHVSMDDFGTGQSSLGRLRELKLDKVKIDRSFVKAVGEDKTAEHIIRAILELCAGLELTVVAEGIENLAQAETLRRYGCHAAQGYLLGKPQDAYRTMCYIRDFMNGSSDEDQAQSA